MDVTNLLVKSRIPITKCLVSNRRLNTLLPEQDEEQIHFLLKVAPELVILSPDNRQVFGTMRGLSKDINRADTSATLTQLWQHNCNIRYGELMTIINNGFNASFIDHKLIQNSLDMNQRALAESAL